MAYKIVIERFGPTLTGADRQGGQKSRIVREEIYRAVLAAVYEMRKILAIEGDMSTPGLQAPVVSGKLKQSWTADVATSAKTITGKVSTNNVAGKVFEMGAKRHFPPTTRRRKARTPGQKGRSRLIGITYSDPALGPWIRRTTQRGPSAFSWRKFDISKPRDVMRLAYIIGRKFKALGRRKDRRYTRALQRSRNRFQLIFDRMMQRIRDRIQRP